MCFFYRQIEKDGADYEANLFSYVFKCVVKTAGIAAEVPKIDEEADISQIKEPIIGVEQGNTADTVKESLEDITDFVAKNGTVENGVVLDKSNHAEEIKNAADSNKNLKTIVNIDNNGKTDSDIISNMEKVAESLVRADVVQNLNITYFDISIKVVEAENNTEIAKVTQLPESKAITFTIALPDSLQKRKVLVIRYHNGKTEQITNAVQSNGFITFTTNKFSPYALVDAGEEYTINFITGNGSSIPVQKVKYNETVQKPANPTRASYRFDGWYTSDSYAVPWDFENNKITGDVTIYAKWTYIAPSIAYYRVTFDSQGGTSTAPITSVREYTVIKEPAAPTKEGYDFAGWYKDAACTVAWDFAKDLVKMNTTLYAKWVEKEPEKPIIVAPAPVTVKVTEKTTNYVTVTWTASEGAEGYTLWTRAEGEEKYTRRKIYSSGDVLTYTWKNRKPGTKYYFVVKAWVKDEAGKYLFSEVSKTVRGTTKPLTAIISDVTVNKNGDLKVTLAGKAAGANRYAMCWSRSEDFSRYAIGIRTQYTKRTMAKALKPGTYYVKVRSYLQLSTSRVYGDWSKAVKVIVK